MKFWLTLHSGRPGAVFNSLEKAVGYPGPRMLECCPKDIIEIDVSAGTCQYVGAKPDLKHCNRCGNPIISYGEDMDNALAGLGFREVICEDCLPKPKPPTHVLAD